jgi:hypothetical protein
MPNDDDLDRVEDIIYELLEYKKQLPWMVRIGLNQVLKGIHKYTFKRDIESGMIRKPISFKTSVVLVVLLHALAFAGILFLPPKRKAMAEEDKKFLKETYVGIEEPKSNRNNQNYPIPNTHIVRKGDTFNGIILKYKLDSNKIKKLNNIKNENHIRIGQVIKLK